MTLQEKMETIRLHLRKAVSKDVGLAAILLYVPVVVLEETRPQPEEANRWVAFTDGVRMYFGADFFSYSKEEQTAIVIHEGLHVAFRHAQRGQALKEREGSSYNHMMFNWACDAVINNSLRNISWFNLPDKSIYPENCVSPDDLKKKPAELWTSEDIYYHMKRHSRRITVMVNDWRGQSAKGDMLDIPLYRDLDPDGRGSKDEAEVRSQLERDMSNSIWRERIIRAQAGSRPGSILRKMSSEVPTPKVRWEKVLRSFISARVMPTTEESWNRPSRRNLSYGDRNPFIEPGTERCKGIKRIGIVIDTSGSINDTILSTFVGEINGIMSKTGCEAIVIDCDAKVQQVTKHQGQIPKTYSARGGGGTDFRPAIEELKKHDIVLGIYLTDLYGEFPTRRPSFPILWAATTDLKPPFGHYVRIPMES